MWEKGIHKNTAGKMTTWKN